MSFSDRLRVVRPGYPLSVGRTLAVYSGLMVALLLAALDQTIVATSLPRMLNSQAMEAGAVRTAASAPRAAPTRARFFCRQHQHDAGSISHSIADQRQMPKSVVKTWPFVWLVA